MHGADPKKCYGIELDESIARLCRNRLSKLNVPESNIKVGNALDSDSYEFDENLYDIKHDQYAIDFEITKEKTVFIKFIKFPYILQKTVELDLKTNIQKIYQLFEKLKEKKYWFISKQNIKKQLNIFNILLKEYNLTLDINQWLVYTSEQQLLKKIHKNKFNSFDDLLSLQE